MNWDRLKSGTTLAAAMMILITFMPESAIRPVSEVLSQFRMNNVSAAVATQTDANVSAVPSKVTVAK